MKEYGVVFAGGGARGSYQIGVWKSLNELGLKIAAVAGTSIGAINGALMVQNDFEKAYRLWQSIEIGDVINLEGLGGSNKKKIGLKELAANLKDIINGRGLDISPLIKMLHEHINERAVRDSEIGFGLVTFSLSDLKPLLLYKEDIPEGKLVDYLIASASLPLFQSHEMDNKRFIDGGAYDNMPVSLIKDKGIRDIITVDVSGIGVVRKWTFRGANIIHIKNSEDLGGILEFDGDRIKRNIEIGYLDALKAFGKYIGTRYYIKNDGDIWKGIMSPLEAKEAEMLYSFLEIDDDSHLTSKLVRYRVMRTLKKYSPGRLDGRTVMLAAAEIAAETMEIERAKVYSLEGIAKEILKAYYSSDDASVFKHSIDIILKLISEDKREGVRLITALSPKISITSLFIALMLWRERSSMRSVSERV